MKNTWATEQVIGILSVDNIKVSNFAKILLDRVDSGEISSEDARQILKQRTVDRINTQCYLDNTERQFV